MNRGKVLSAQDVAERGFARYKDLDGDGVPYRTLPGNENPRASWFARGTGHNEAAVYSEKPVDWENNMFRLARKFETARDIVPGPVIEEMDGAEVAILAYGTTEPAIEEARDRLTAMGLPTSFIRLRALPFNHEVSEFIGRYERVYVVELNRDAQMQTILQAELPELATRFVSLAHLDGMPLTARWVVEALMAVENERPRRAATSRQAKEQGATELDLPGDGSLSPGNGMPVGDSGLTDMGHDGRNRETIIEIVENREN
jgi:2-oxoglutarate ferredoxin oxidoreductase subunit alpha